MIDWQSLGFQVLNGLVWGVLFALIALGLNTIYGLLGVVNMAHGSLYAMGAILGWYGVSWLGSFWLACLIAPLGVAAVSVPIYDLVLRRTIGREMMIGLLATAGLLLILDDSALAIFGGTPRSILAPLPGSVRLLDLNYPVYRFAASGIAALVLLAFWAFLRFTKMGIWMRCTAQSPDLAMAVGVPVVHVNRLAVALSGYFAGLAGVLAAPITLVHYQMGLAVLGPAFIVIVVGGLRNLAGAVTAAMLIGVVRGVLTAIVPPTWADILSVAMLLPLLIVRPHGLFGDTG
jgi:branched-chain amino acid transport system permease protein